jgi:hypothetical protein
MTHLLRFGVNFQAGIDHARHALSTYMHVLPSKVASHRRFVWAFHPAQARRKYTPREFLASKSFPDTRKME